jgi:hypothetical protein
VGKEYGCITLYVLSKECLGLFTHSLNDPFWMLISAAALVNFAIYNTANALTSILCRTSFYVISDWYAN